MKYLHTGIVVLLMGMTTSYSFCQNINGYARVTNITGNVLTVTNVSEASDTYEDGEQVLVIQVQDDVIGGNTADNVNFGDLAAIASAGLYELATIGSHTESAGLPTTLTLTAPLGNTYHTGANSRVQVVTFPQLGSPHYTTTANISGLAWNGNIGGVVAFQVTGTLTLNHNISANGIGFRGGAVSANFYDGTTNCINTPFISSLNRHGFKGEGIYAATDVNFTNARGKILNGGGGGNHINGGGGGGGNFTAGGNGGPGWNGTATGCPVVNYVSGLGALGLAAHINPQRVFMGGGGGGGQQNNGVGRAGGNGGGLIFIKANALTTSGTCTNRRISANGNSSTIAGNDGSGGGGAGGSIVLEIDSYNALAACPLVIEANGGAGGGVNTSTHSGGGGGGQGVVVFSIARPITNITTTTLNGAGGCNNNTCSSIASPGAGANNIGIIEGTTLLPISWISFEAELMPQQRHVVLQWKTAANPPCDFYVVQRSTNGYDFVNISDHITHEHWIDESPLIGVSYYRIVAQDVSGQQSYSAIKAIEYEQEQNLLRLYPNPAKNSINIDFPAEKINITQLLICASNGQIYALPYQITEGRITIDVTPLPAGFYVVKIQHNQGANSLKLVVE